MARCLLPSGITASDQSYEDWHRPATEEHVPGSVPGPSGGRRPQGRVGCVVLQPPGALCSLLGTAVLCWCVMFGHISGLEELLGSSIPHFLISLQASRC